jgi:phosphoserine phosphatase RsbU/P
MDTMPLNATAALHDQITDRRHKLESAIASLGPRPELTHLLADVDAALQRLDAGTYGLCETCHDVIEADRLLADPLTRFCLDHLTPAEQRALEHDLLLAARIQRGLLPNPSQTYRGWEAAYHYQPARLVSGDYVDIVDGDGAVYFMLGDVSGKGVAASTLMAHLHALVRALVSMNLPLAELLGRASRMFCESTLPMHYATLVCGRATPDGIVEISNAGHLPAVLVQANGVKLLGSTGLPIGMFCDQRFIVERIEMAPGDTIVACTDGITEAEDGDGVEYGLERFAAAISERRSLLPQQMIDGCVRGLGAHRGAIVPNDDGTIMVVRRAP